MLSLSSLSILLEFPYGVSFCDEWLPRGTLYPYYYPGLSVVHLTSLYSLPLATSQLIPPLSHPFWVFLGDLLTNLY